MKNNMVASVFNFILQPSKLSSFSLCCSWSLHACGSSLLYAHTGKYQLPFTSQIKDLLVLKVDKTKYITGE